MTKSRRIIFSLLAAIAFTVGIIGHKNWTEKEPTFADSRWTDDKWVFEKPATVDDMKAIARAELVIEVVEEDNDTAKSFEVFDLNNRTVSFLMWLDPPSYNSRTPYLVTGHINNGPRFYCAWELRLTLADMQNDRPIAHDDDKVSWFKLNLEDLKRCSRDQKLVQRDLPRYRPKNF